MNEIINNWAYDQELIIAKEEIHDFINQIYPEGKLGRVYLNEKSISFSFKRYPEDDYHNLSWKER